MQFRVAWRERKGGRIESETREGRRETNANVSQDQDSVCKAGLHWRAKGRSTSSPQIPPFCLCCMASRHFPAATALFLVHSVLFYFRASCTKVGPRELSSSSTVKVHVLSQTIRTTPKNRRYVCAHAHIRMLVVLFVKVVAKNSATKFDLKDHGSEITTFQPKIANSQLQSREGSHHTYFLQRQFLPPGDAADCLSPCDYDLVLCDQGREWGGGGQVQFRGSPWDVDCSVLLHTAPRACTHLPVSARLHMQPFPCR